MNCRHRFCASSRPIIATFDEHSKRGGGGNSWSNLLPWVSGEIDSLQESHLLAGFSVVGDAKDAISPVVHLQLAESESQERHQALQTLQHIADTALKRFHVFFTVNKTSALDRVQLTPSIRWPPPHAQP
jgi:hypothetical protein